MAASHSGRVTSIDEHHANAKHATITVTHGKKKRDKEGELVGYDQPTSRVVVPKAHAKNFNLGQRVDVGVSPASEADDGDEMDESDEAPARKGKATTGKRAAPPPKGKRATPKTDSPIKKAMLRG
ncbi:MAG: hypothetical protein JWM41_2881 [Gemmatimonadetes bacterium]|nr:hypothetical protein [Gemmatimonadota bacterium]